MRRFMMRIAEKGRGRGGLLALITGESLGLGREQDHAEGWPSPGVCGCRYFQSLHGMDKEEIIRIARRMHVRPRYLPFMRTVHVFTPKNPNTKPKMPKISRGGKHNLLDVERSWTRRSRA